MAVTATKLPVKTQPETAQTPAPTRHPLETLQNEIDRLFNDFSQGWPFRKQSFGMEPFWRGEVHWGALPAVDVVEKDHAYELTAELPGMDEKAIDLKVSGNMLTVTGEKQEEKEEKKRGYHVSERRYGSFERSFRIPETVEVEKIDATFRNGVLTVTLPKKAGVEAAEKKIAVKSG